MMPVILLGGIVAGIGTPTEVSTFAVLYGLALGLALSPVQLDGHVDGASPARRC